MLLSQHPAYGNSQGGNMASTYLAFGPQKGKELLLNSVLGRYQKHHFNEMLNLASQATSQAGQAIYVSPAVGLLVGGTPAWFQKLIVIIQMLNSDGGSNV